jgi:ATP-binding protein involved in chromosome partitioning
MKMQTEHKQGINAAKNLEGIKHRLVVMSGKGGVGKSTVASNLALALSLQGYKVGLLDADIHGPSIPKMLGIEDRKLTGGKDGLSPVLALPNLKVASIGFLLRDQDSPVIWRGPLKMRALQQFLEEVSWGELDFLIVDLPPGTGDEPLSIAQLMPESDAIIVTTPQNVALLSVRKSINFAKTLKMQVVGIIENMSGLVCPHCGRKIDLFKTGGGEKAARDFLIPFLGKIPIDPKIVEEGDNGAPFVLSQKDSPAAKAFDEIVQKIEKRYRLIRKEV